MRQIASPKYFLDLFAGSGGFTLGLESAGLSSLGSIEIDSVAQATLKTNFGEPALPSVRDAAGDVTKVDLKALKRDLLRMGISNLDVLIACPPCQAFSRIGRGKLDSLAGEKGGHHADPRNLLYKKVFDYLRVLRPKVFVFENVPGMLSVGGKNIAEKVCQGAAESGYQVRAALLNAAWFGVPQFRERIIIIGFRNDLRTVPQFPAIQFDGLEIDGHMSASDSLIRLWSDDRFFIQYSKLPKVKNHQPFRNVEDALGDLPPFFTHLDALRHNIKYSAVRSLHSGQRYNRGRLSPFRELMRNWPGFESGGYVEDHFCRWTPRDFRTFQRMKEGDTYPRALEIAKQLYARAKKRNPKIKKSEIVPPYPDSSFEEKWRKLVKLRPSWTVTAHLSRDTYSHIHYDSAQARAITPREAARLQSFPDGFKFAGNTGDIYRQIGNAVPPLLAMQVGKQILLQLGADIPKPRYSHSELLHPQL